MILLKKLIHWKSLSACITLFFSKIAFSYRSHIDDSDNWDFKSSFYFRNNKLPYKIVVVVVLGVMSIKVIKFW